MKQITLLIDNWTWTSKLRQKKWKTVHAIKLQIINKLFWQTRNSRERPGRQDNVKTDQMNATIVYNGE